MELSKAFLMSDWDEVQKEYPDFSKKKQESFKEVMNQCGGYFNIQLPLAEPVEFEANTSY